MLRTFGGGGGGVWQKISKFLFFLGQDFFFQKKLVRQVIKLEWPKLLKNLIKLEFLKELKEACKLRSDKHFVKQFVKDAFFRHH